MTASRDRGPRHPIGISRRELLQVGYTGLLGIGLPALLARPALGGQTSRPGGKAQGRAKSVILVFLTGAPDKPTGAGQPI